MLRWRNNATSKMRPGSLTPRPNCVNVKKTFRVMNPTTERYMYCFAKYHGIEPDIKDASILGPNQYISGKQPFSVCSMYLPNFLWSKDKKASFRGGDENSHPRVAVLPEALV